MNHSDIQSTDDLIRWLRNNAMDGVDTTTYVTKYLMETVDTLQERNVGPVSVRIRVKPTYSGCDQDLMGYLTSLTIWEGEMNFSAQSIYFPVVDGKIVAVLTTHRPGI
ncbi:hypothetical protein [Paraburkholderia sp. BCC1886]|uniref:hypothetical protein n=1 Tax=Paraburkholderia sp. BCC1886 TaxID=2562670 RepID=UPI0011822771|nr:hypothetical protein [Paraburkholderia sp. BCC1886]